MSARKDVVPPVLRVRALRPYLWGAQGRYHAVLAGATGTVVAVHSEGGYETAKVLWDSVVLYNPNEPERPATASLPCTYGVKLVDVHVLEGPRRGRT